MKRKVIHLSYSLSKTNDFLKLVKNEIKFYLILAVVQSNSTASIFYCKSQVYLGFH